MVVDCFTKWVEVERGTAFIELKAIYFLLKDVMTRYRLPRSIIVDNGWQFISKNINQYYI